MSLANTCRMMTLHYITATHLHLRSGKKTSLQVFSICILLQYHTDTSQECSYLIHHACFLYFVPLPFTEVVQSAPSTPSYLLIYVLLCYTPHPLCFCGSFLSAQGPSLHFRLNLAMFPLVLVCSFYLPLNAFSRTCVASLHFFLSHYKETLTLSI